MVDERAGGRGAQRKSRRRRLGISGGIGAPPEWTPSAEDWKKLEAAYGSPLDDDLRAAISKAVAQYFYWANFEPIAPFADDFIGKLRNVKRLAMELKKSISALGDARHLIAPHWEHYFPREDDDELLDEDDDSLFDRLISEAMKYRGRDHRDLIEVARTICDALDDAMKHVASPNAGEFIEGDEWRALITNLARAFAAKGFKVSASKDLQKGRPSLFVMFVQELQSTFPEGLRRHTNLDALSGEISKALRLLRPKKLKLPQRFKRNGRLSRGMWSR